MPALLSKLQSPQAIQAALDEFSALGRTGFLDKHGYGKSRDYLVVNPRSGELADSKAIAGVAYGHQFPEEGALRSEDFSGGESTVVPKLQSLGFSVVRIGEDWSESEVDSTVSAYFRMLDLEARQAPYKKSEFNAELRQSLKGRSKASVELKFQNVSAVLNALGLPFIQGYKPRGNSQLLLRKAVQQFALDHPEQLTRIVDAMEDMRPIAEKPLRAVLVTQPPIESVTVVHPEIARPRLPRKIDFASRDESNRRLGRAGEQWALEFEQQRLAQAGMAELFARVDWVSDRLGDGTGFDILSYDSTSKPRYIEVKTTNGGHTSAFIISRNELEFSKETADLFFLYRLFQFRESPTMYMLQGDISKHVHLEALDYRASFRRIRA